MSSAKTNAALAKRSKAERSSAAHSRSVSAVNTAEIAATQENISPQTTVSAIYSSNAMPGINPVLQGKFIQLKEDKQTEDTSNENTDDVQMRCAECEAELEQGEENVQPKNDTGSGTEDDVTDDTSGNGPVQMWDCSDEEKPACSMQTKEAAAGTFQLMCAECEAEQEQGEEAVQSKADTASESEDDVAEDTGGSEPVQMWDCSDEEKPACSMQTKEAGTGTVQLMCAECEAELDEGEENVQSKSDAGSENDEADTDEMSNAEAVQSKAEEPMTDEDSGEVIQTKPVQPKSQKKAKRRGSILRDANKGLANARSPLPHHDKIQDSFGHHDISNVRTDVGGAAGHASRRMGALAYASGERIGFRQSPGLHLAAHEAAHTVQQRSGLKLPGNVGKPGDRYERHADQVADAVVAGKSAEPLLDSMTPVAGNTATASTLANGDGISGAVQHRLTSAAVHQTEPKAADKKSEEGEEESAGGGGGGAKGAEGGAGAEAEAQPQDAESTEVAEENAEEQDPAADCEEAQGDDEGEQESAAATEGGGEEAAEESSEESGTPEKGRCYVADAEDPPEGAEEPTGDPPANDVDEESDVKFGKWEEADDRCECAARDAMDQQSGGATAEGGGSLLSAEVGTSTPGEAGAAAQASESGGNEEGAAGGGEAEAGGGAGNAGAAGGESEAAAVSFAQNEATRDTAIAEYMSATAQVSKAPERTANLANGLRFSDAKPGNAQVEAQRAMALKQIQDFMLRSNSQIESAAMFVATEVPARLRAQAEAAKASIEASMATEKSLISSRIAQAKLNAIASAVSARATINTEHDTNVNTVNTETDTAIQALTDAYTTAKADIADREQTSLDEINRRFHEGRTAHEDKGDTYASGAIDKGQEWVESYDHCRAGPGNDNKYNNEDGFWDGCLTVRRAKAQQEAACSAASGTAKNMVKMAEEKGFKLREQRTDKRCSIIAGAGAAQQTLDETFEQLTSGLESGRAGTLDGLAQTRDSGLSSVLTILSVTLKSLSEQEREQRQAVNDSGYVQQLAVEQLAHQVAAGLAGSVNDAVDSLESTLQQLREQLLQGDAPPPEALAEALASAEAGLGGGIGTLMDKMQEGAANAEMQISDAAANAAGALQQITAGNEALTSQSEQGFNNQITSLVSGIKDAMAQLAERQVSKAQDSATEGSASMQQMVAGFIESTESIYTEADTAISTSLGELDTDLINMRDGLEARIAAEAWRAASKEQPAWKGALAIVLIVLVIIASIVVSVLTAGAGGVLGAILIGALVGAITSGLIQVINNWAAGEEWDKGLGTAIAIGAIGGAIGGAFGAGANAVAGVALKALPAAAGTVTRAAVNVGINLAGDLLAEGATQLVNYGLFGQKMNWEGFVMAGGMSVLSTARGGITGPHPSAGGAAAAAGRPRLHAPNAGDAAIGLGFGLAMEGVHALAGGEFDATRFATTAAGAAGGSWGARAGSAPETPSGSRRSSSAAETPSTPTRPSAPAAEASGTPTRPSAPVAEAPSTPTRPSAPAAEAPSTPTRPGAEAETPTTPRRSATDAESEAGTVRPHGEADAETPASRSRSRGEADAEGTTPRGRGEGTEADSRIRPDTEDVNTIPAKDLEDTTRKQTVVGEEPHSNFFNRRSDRVECDVCSVGCGNIIKKLDTMIDDLPNGSLRTSLQDLKQRIETVEAGIENASMSHRDVIAESGRIASELRAIGTEHPELGQALNNPGMFRDTYEPRVDATGGPDHIRTDNLGDPNGLHVSSTVRHEVDVADYKSLNFPSDADIIYVLRDRSGAVVKVGETSGSTFESRFSRYATASSKQNLDLDLVLEVNVVSVANRGSLTPKQARKQLELELRNRLEGEGHVLPWDYDDPKGRLGREGPGVPFESPPGGSPLRDHTWGREGTEKGYLLPPGGGRTNTRLVRRDATTSTDELAAFLRNNPTATKSDIARHFDVHHSVVSSWFTRPTWLDGLRREGINFSQWLPKPRS